MASFLERFLGPLSLRTSDQWLKEQLGGGSGATGSWEETLIPPMEEAVGPDPRGEPDPSILNYLAATATAAPEIATTGLFRAPQIGQDIANRARFFAQSGRTAMDALRGAPEAATEFGYGLAGLEPPPAAPDPKLSFPAATAPIAPDQPMMEMQTPPTDMTPPSSKGYVHLTDKAGNVLKDYTGTGSSYKPSEMLPGSSAYEFFERPRQDMLLKQQLEQAKIQGVQAETAKDQYLLEQARKLGPQVFFGQTGDADTRRLQSMMDLVESRARVKVPEATRAVKLAWEKANPGKVFERDLSEIDRNDSIAAYAKKLAQDELEQTQRTIMGAGLFGALR